MILDEFEFELSTKIKFQSPAGEEESNILLLKSPLAKHERTLTKLQQKFVKAIIDAGRKNASNQSSKKTEQKTPSATEVIIVLQQSDLDYYDFKEDFYSMILNGLCFIGDGIKVTKDLLSNVSFDDKDKLLGEYFANFMMPSWMLQTT